MTATKELVSGLAAGTTAAAAAPRAASVSSAADFMVLFELVSWDWRE